jgi:2-(1,2-epoxy-1,2-dihydrophenyl)acetyl-CoA isomerase
MTASKIAASLVRVDCQQGIATIALNRPERHNSLSPQMLEQLRESIGKVRALPDTRVIVLTAAGRSFSTGGDLDAFQDHREDIEAYADTVVGALNETIASIVECDIPVVAAVDGQVTGGSCGLVFACDIVIVTERASFTPYYTQIGFSPDGGWTALLPEIIGRKRAIGVQLLNDTISARDALDWGIAYKMAQPDRLDTAISDLCIRIINLKPGSIRMTKRLFRPERFRERLDAEREAFIETIADREALDGIDDFIAARS